MIESESYEKHVFKDCEPYFAEKIHSFHDKFVDAFLLIGIDTPRKPLDEIKMTKNPLYSLLYYKRIIGGLKITKPLINIRLIENKKLNTECSIYYLNNTEDIENFYLVQRVMNWKNSKLTSHQVWQIDSIDYHELNNHWL